MKLLNIKVFRKNEKPLEDEIIRVRLTFKEDLSQTHNMEIFFTTGESSALVGRKIKALGQLIIDKGYNQ